MTNVSIDYAEFLDLVIEIHSLIFRIMSNHSDVIAFLGNNKNLPGLPAITTTVMRLSLDPDVSLNQIAAEIEKDTAFSLRILKLVNSAYFGLPTEVRDLRHAVSILGSITIRNISITLSLIDIFPTIHQTQYQDLFAKSFCAGAAADLISAELKIRGREDIFLTSLLQFSGEFVLASSYAEKYAYVTKESHDRGISRSVVEKELFGITNLDIAEHITKEWKMPPLIGDLIKYRIQKEFKVKTDWKWAHKTALEIAYLGGLAAEFYYGSKKLINLIRWRSGVANLLNQNNDDIEENILTRLPEIIFSTAKELNLRNPKPLEYNQVLKLAETELLQLNLKHEHNYLELKNLMKLKTNQKWF